MTTFGSLQDESFIRHFRGYLPHYDATQQAQFITYRLFDSLPRIVVARLDEELKSVSPYDKKAERYRRMEEYLDQGLGSCSLQRESIGSLVEENLLHFDGKRYVLHAWVIMPNHVHVLLTPANNNSLSNIVHSWKSYTAKQANAILDSNAEFWQREYYDRLIRNEWHFNNTFEYIHNNPVKAGLCATPRDWKFSSARFLSDVDRQ